MASVRRLFAEARRRRVFRAMAWYGGFAWFVIQAANNTFHAFAVPDWVLRATVVACALGFPVVVGLAWYFDISRRGFVRTASVPADHPALVRDPWRSPSLWLGIAAGALLALAVVGTWNHLQPQPRDAAAVGAVPSGGSIAVLPLVSAESSDEDRGLGDGLSEELASRLSQLRGLRVASQGAIFEQLGAGHDALEVGRRLGVAHVLSGQASRAGGRVRVVARLIEVESGHEVWGGEYTEPDDNLLALQAQVATSLAVALGSVLSHEDEQRVRREPTHDARAFALYLDGVSLMRRSGDLDGLARARELLMQAVAIDPRFARAHAALCEIGVDRYAKANEAADVVAAESACRAALDADPMLKETELALGKLYRIGGRYEQADAVYRRLIEAGEADAEVFLGRARALQKMKRPDAAIESARQAIALEPGYWRTHAALGGFLFEVGRYAEAMALFRKATELAPWNASDFSNLGGAALAVGDLATAAAAYQRSLDIKPSHGALNNLATAHYYLGRYADAAAGFAAAAELAPELHQPHGGLGDALAQIAGRGSDARAAYQRAATKAEQALQVNGSDPQTLAALAWYESNLGDEVAADAHLDRAAALGVGDTYVSYFAALIAARRGEDALARTLADDARRLGFSSAILELDPVLKASRARAPSSASAAR
jgi:TolB-like protein/tetratricopeptide (TPR) repeat protein